MFKKLKSWIIVLLAMFAIVYAAGLFQHAKTKWAYAQFVKTFWGVDPSALPSTKTTLAGAHNDKTAITNVSGTEYRIPLKYLGYPVKEKNETTILINAVLPDMKPNDPEHAIRQENLVIILTDDDKSTTDVAARATITQKLIAPLKPLPDRYGLHAFVGSKMSLGDKSFHRDVPDEWLNDEFFMDAGSRENTTYIDCLGDKAAPEPGCKEVFDVDGLLYQVTFNKKHLSEWKSIRAASSMLMQSFVVKKDPPSP